MLNLIYVERPWRSQTVLQKKYQQMLPDDKRTMMPDELAMVSTYRWDGAMIRFYWRAKALVLHTNAVKHLFYPSWPAKCTCCSDECLDTQNHRFGITQPHCVHVDRLRQNLNKTFCHLERELWLPARVYSGRWRAYS
ncbi:hypothetical protein PHMEG_00029525 [Phytophthora megakarya]|uniref:Uncharacterized protein n=1 Tax=Phytophthora megakarya TaxID=4795 RepID=A0A225V2J4_9STRA|nr:hypothetical protein PHMEG_00029525 [Phytophthora megakarya]